MRKTAQGSGGITLEVFKKHVGVMMSGPGSIRSKSGLNDPKGLVQR